jgi:O-antigen/teichoic acid export membrane protein
MLATYFSTTIVGYYDLSFRILQLPTNLIGSAIGQVFYQRAAEAKIEGTLHSLFENVFRLLVIIAVFPMIILIVLGRDLFVLVFGINWTTAGEYAQILSCWFFFCFISSPLSTLYLVLEKQEFGLKWDTVNFSTRLVSLFIGCFVFNNAKIALIFFALSGICVYGYLILTITRFAGVKRKTILRIIIKYFLYSIPFGIILFAMDIYAINIWMRILTVLSCSILYYLYALKGDIRAYMEKEQANIASKRNSTKTS